MKKYESSATCWSFALHATTEAPPRLVGSSCPGTRSRPDRWPREGRVGEPAKAQDCATAARAAS